MRKAAFGLVVLPLGIFLGYRLVKSYLKKRGGGQPEISPAETKGLAGTAPESGEAEGGKFLAPAGREIETGAPAAVPVTLEVPKKAAPRKSRSRAKGGAKEETAPPRRPRRKPENA